MIEFALNSCNRMLRALGLGGCAQSGGPGGHGESAVCTAKCRSPKLEWDQSR